MAPPLYFLPGVTIDQLVVVDGADRQRFSRPQLERFRLLETFGDIDDLRSAAALVEIPGAGPGGQSGVLLSALPGGRPLLRFGYREQAQRWRQASLDPPLWIGVDREYPPTPADLARAGRPIEGYDCTLGDGRRWHVPVVRSPLRGTHLPRAVGYEPDGQLTLRLLDAWQPLWDRSEALWDMAYGDDPDRAEMTFAEIFEHCVALLAVNYRVDRYAATLLGLVTTDTWQEIFHAALDVPLVRDQLSAQKKTSDS